MPAFCASADCAARARGCATTTGSGMFDAVRERMLEFFGNRRDPSLIHVTTRNPVWLAALSGVFAWRAATR